MDTQTESKNAGQRESQHDLPDEGKFDPIAGVMEGQLRGRAGLHHGSAREKKPEDKQGAEEQLHDRDQVGPDSGVGSHA